MKAHQEGVLELLTIKEEGLSCLDVDSISPDLSMGMAKRGVYTHVKNSNKEILRQIDKQSHKIGISNMITLEYDDNKSFDYILLRQSSNNIDDLFYYYQQLASNGVLLLRIQKRAFGLAKVERLLKKSSFLDVKVYLNFGEKNKSAFIIPKVGFDKYYYRYWSWKKLKIFQWPHKLLEYFCIYKLRQLWLASSCIILIKK